MLLAMTLAAAVLEGEPTPVRATPMGALSACKSETLYQAAECLRSNLSESDRIALLANQRGSSIRGQIDRLVQFEFRLYEPTSKVGQWLKERNIGSPMAQSAVIIDEYLAQQRGATLDLGTVAKAARDIPIGIPPTESELLAETTETVLRTKMSREECSSITKLPLAEIGECSKQGDRILVSRMKKAESN